MKTTLEFDIVHLTFDGIKVFVNEEVSCLVRELGRRLPKERCHIIIDRTSATTLEVNEIWFSILQHDVARLEVTIEEGVLLVIKQIISQALEVLLELVLVELDTLELEEAVLEIVEVEHDARPIHLPLWETMVEELVGSVADDGQELETWQFTDGRFQSLHRLSIQCAVYLTMLCHERIERGVATILLQINHPVIRDRQHSRNRQATLLETLCQINECLVLLLISANDSDER